MRGRPWSIVAGVVLAGAVAGAGWVGASESGQDPAVDEAQTSAVVPASPGGGRPLTPAVDDVDTLGGVPVHVTNPAHDSPAPVVVYVHGGGWIAGQVAPQPAEWELDRVVDRGWAVVSVDYRLASLAGPTTIEDQVLEIDRVLGALRRGERADRFDVPAGLVSVGHSAGGHLATLHAVTAPQASRPDAVVSIAGVYDFDADVVENFFLSSVVPIALGCDPCSDLLRRVASPAAHLDPGDPAVHLVHGEIDGIVPVSTARRMAAAARAAGAQHSTTIVPSGGHAGDALGAAVAEVLRTLTPPRS